MSSDKEGQKCTFVCDVCEDEVEVQSHSIKEAWEYVRDSKGWRCFKNAQGEWEHRCPECVGR